MIISCEGCLKLPICRHKRFVKLLLDCADSRQALYENASTFGFRYRTPDFDENVTILRDVLNPTKWDTHMNIGEEDHITVIRL